MSAARKFIATIKRAFAKDLGGRQGLALAPFLCLVVA